MKKSLATILIATLVFGAILNMASASTDSTISAEEEATEEEIVSTEVENKTDVGEDILGAEGEGSEENGAAEAGETEHSKEEEDIEEEMELKEDDEGDLHITSDDNTIRFKEEEPRVRFKYNATDENMTEFEAEDFALIEFVDKNNDGKIQSGEIKQKLEFDDDDILWNFTYTKVIEGNNTIITVTYYTNATEYEIALVMRIYQRRATESFTTGNATLVFDIDGGADEVKFDLIVSRWTWVDESSKLALLMELESEVEGDVALESLSVDKDQVAIKLDSIKIKVGWVKKAKIVAANGTEELVNVTVAYESLDIELEGSEVELELDVYFIYPYFGENKLVHDPSFGVEDDLLRYIFTLITPELLLGTAITATVVMAVAFGAARRKKKLPTLGNPPTSTL